MTKEKHTIANNMDNEIFGECAYLNEDEGKV